MMVMRKFCSLSRRQQWHLTVWVIVLSVYAGTTYLLMFNRNVQDKQQRTLSGRVIPKQQQQQEEESTMLHRRQLDLLILAGPHKTASTTIQKFLGQLNRHPSQVLQEQHWHLVKGHPLVPKTLLVPPEWTTSTTNNNDTNNNLLLQRWVHDKGRLSRRYLSNYTNTKEERLLWAQENFDILAGLQRHEADQAIQRIWNWLGIHSSNATVNLQAAVMYRTPRIAHLISMWKESMNVDLHNMDKEPKFPWRTKVLIPPTKDPDDHRSWNQRRRGGQGMPPSLAEWMCSGIWPGTLEYNISLQLATWINPWGLVYALVNYANATKVTLVDMAGIVQDDVPSLVACDLLQLPYCKERIIPVVPIDTEVNESATAATTTTSSSIRRQPQQQQQQHQQQHQQHKKFDLTDFDYGKVWNASPKAPGPTGFNDDEQAKVEEILLEMDCYYFCELGKTTSFEVLYPTAPIFYGGLRQGWERCCQMTEQQQQHDKSSALFSLDGTATAMRLRNLACQAHSRAAQE